MILDDIEVRRKDSEKEGATVCLVLRPYRLVLQGRSGAIRFGQNFAAALSRVGIRSTACMSPWLKLPLGRVPSDR